MNKSNLQDKIRELRDLINSSICCKQGAWDRKDSGGWNKLWTAVDNIEDTQLAITEYSSLKSFSRLAVYGLLQAMVVQQNAISHLEKAIKIQKPNWSKDYPDLFFIRNIRIETVGHPTSTKRDGGDISYTSISYSSNLNILEYGIWCKTDFQHKTINLKNIIAIQQNLLIKEIDRIMTKIKEDEMQHKQNKQNFKNESLSEMLATTSYHIQKLWSFEKSRELSRINFKSLKSIYENFKEEIKKRFKIDKINEQGVQIPGLISAIQHVEKILPRIEKMLPMDGGVDQFDLDVYVESLNKSFNDLREMAKEIDDEFINKN